MSVVKDKATAFRNEITGSTTNKIVCKSSSHEMAGPKKKHVDCEFRSPRARVGEGPGGGRGGGGGGGASRGPACRDLRMRVPSFPILKELAACSVDGALRLRTRSEYYLWLMDMLPRHEGLPSSPKPPLPSSPPFRPHPLDKRCSGVHGNAGGPPERPHASLQLGGCLQVPCCLTQPHHTGK